MNLNNTLSPPAKRFKFFFNIKVDPILLTLIVLLSGIGIIILFSASSGNHAMVIRQVTRMMAAYLIMMIFAQLPPYKYQLWAPVLFGIGVVLLIAVLFVGKSSKGAQRWLDFKLFRLQPSELMKIIVPLMLAWFFSQKSLPSSLKDLAIAGILLLIPGLLIARQPDLGTALMVMFSGCAVIFFAGISYRILGLMLSVTLISGPFLWHMLHEYQKLRVLNFLDPERDPLGSGYHIIQSKIAIGSGGLLGKGYLNGTQSHLHFLPEHATDFIFSVFCEEFGFVGAIGLIILFTCIIYRCLKTALSAHDTFARMLTISLTMNFFLSSFVNIGMVTGILPVVGIPLPLISYGGSSLLVFFASFGMIMSVYADSKTKLMRTTH